MIGANYSCEGQMSMFELTQEVFKIRKPIRLIELFAIFGQMIEGREDFYKEVIK